MKKTTKLSGLILSAGLLGLSTSASAQALRPLPTPTKLQRFTKLDTNKDGSISPEERAAHHKAKGAWARKGKTGQKGKAKRPERMKRTDMEHKRLKRADLNRDGKLQLNELLRQRSEGVDKRFSRLDANHDGFVSKAELERSHAQRGPKGQRPKMKKRS